MMADSLGGMAESDAKYSRIWKSMEHCVEVCILSTFRNATEILYGPNWKLVHERCRWIIEKHMKELNINDPHEIDRAVCWYAVSTGKDRDPTWRCISAIFFAAAMEIVMSNRINGEKFKKVGVVGGSEVDDMRKQIDALLREIRSSHGQIHNKLDNIKTGGGITQTQVAQHQSVIHVNNTHINHPSAAQSPDDFFRRIVELLKSKGYDPHGPKEDLEFKNL